MKRKRRAFGILVATLSILLLFNFVLLCCLTEMEETKTGTTTGVVLDPNASDERPSEGAGSSPGVTV